MKHVISFVAIISAAPVFAEETRQLDAHEHGVGTLDIAIEGTTVALSFHAPGADIVGFEYAAKSDGDLAAIDAALQTLSAPLDLFVMPEAAGCRVDQAMAELEGGDHDDHGDEDHDAHADDDHDDHEDEDHGGEDHADEADEVGHTEFHADYTLTCDTPDALSEITFAYFGAFTNALEVEVQMITASGAQAFEVVRDAPRLDLGR